MNWYLSRHQQTQSNFYYFKKQLIAAMRSTFITKINERIYIMQDFNTTYKLLDQRFNTFAQDNKLGHGIKKFLEAKQQNSEFDASPYVEHALVDAASLVFSAIPIKGFVLNFDAAHHGIDYLQDKANHEALAKTDNLQRIVSENLMKTLYAVKGGMPDDPVYFLSFHKKLLNINPHFLDPIHYEEFMNLRGKAQLDASKYHYLQTIDNNKLLQELQNNQDRTINRMIELKEMQVGLNTFVVNAHADLQELMLQLNEQGIEHSVQLKSILLNLKKQGIEIDDKLKNVLLQLRDQGVEINANVLSGLLKNKLIQNDVQTVIAYLKDMELQKIKQQQHELKMANYQGLASACGFMCELGSVIGSRDLIRIGQIAHAGIQIHQAAEQLLNPAFIGTAMLSPYMAIGMAALKIFTLFQNQDNPQKIMMKQLANISKQIKELHQDMLTRFDRMDEKLDFFFKKMIAGFQHLDVTLHVYVESKLLQIQSEILTLSKITQTGFEELLLKDLFEQMQHVDDVRQGIITPSLSESKFHDRMGKLSRFVYDGSCSKLFNGLIYDHLLKDTPGSTQQLISICSQQSASIWHGLLGLLTKFSKDNLNMLELQQILPYEMFHPGLWQAAVDVYCNMQAIYANQYSYDLKKLNIAKFKAQGEKLLNVVNLFSTNKQLYQNLLSLIFQCNKKLEPIFKKISSSITQHAQQPRLIFEIPKSIINSDKNRKIHASFFTIDNSVKLLKKAKIEIPIVFFNAQALGLGYLEFQWHLPDSVRSRKHHKGEKAVSKGQKAGLEITFVTGTQRMTLLTPGLSDKFHCDTLDGLYFHILTYSRFVCSGNLVNQVNAMINKDSLDAKKAHALEISQFLLQESAYHRLLKLDHFLIVYLTFGGFSEELIIAVKNNLLLDNVAEQFARFAQNLHLNVLPEIKFSGKDCLGKIQKLIFSEIDKEKTSQIAVYIHKGILSMDKLEIAAQALPSGVINSSYKPGQTRVEFLAAPSPIKALMITPNSAVLTKGNSKVANMAHDRFFHENNSNISTLLQQAKISPKNNQDKAIIEIKFFDIELAKKFRDVIHKIGISNQNMSNEPKKIDISQELGNNECCLYLTDSEYDAIAGEDAFISLISNAGSSITQGGGR